MKVSIAQLSSSLDKVENVKKAVAYIKEAKRKGSDRQSGPVRLPKRQPDQRNGGSQAGGEGTEAGRPGFHPVFRP